MTQRTIVQLIDDLDGVPADETISFGLDGSAYEIDLSNANAKHLREAFAPYVDAGRSIRQPRRSPIARAPVSDIDTKAVRAWAIENGYEISARGRVPESIVDAYRNRG